MIDISMMSLYNNGNGLGSGGYVRCDEEEEKDENDNTDSINFKDLAFISIFDQLADAISNELLAIENAKKAKINFDNKF